VTQGVEPRLHRQPMPRPRADH